MRLVGYRLMRFGNGAFLPVLWSAFFFFQAEDGIRDVAVTGVQTCALPISIVSSLRVAAGLPGTGRRNDRGDPRDSMGLRVDPDAAHATGMVGCGHRARGGRQDRKSVV